MANQINSKKTKTLLREERRTRQAAKKRTKRWIFIVVVGTAAVAIIAGLFMPQFLNRGPTDLTDGRSGPGVHPSIQPAQHIVRGQAHPDYNSVPATSGWHYSDAGAPITWGTHSSFIPEEVLLHNLEHGGIAIQYDPNLDPGIIASIESYAEKLPGYPACVVVAPYPGLESPIAMTAWGAMILKDSLDTEINSFFESYANKGPEYLGPDCGSAGYMGR